MNKEPGDRLKKVGKVISEDIPGVSFVLIVFDKEPGKVNYVSNRSKDEIVIATREFLAKLKTKMELGPDG